MFCWFYKLMISNALDNDNQLSRQTKKHVRKCPDCQQFYETCSYLGQELGQQVGLPNKDYSERLNEDILLSLSDKRPETIKSETLWKPVLIAACLVVVFSIAILFVAKYFEKPVPDTRIPDVEVLIAQLPDSIESPLRIEFENLVSDTESAVRFLVTCVDVDIADSKIKN